MDDGRKPVLGYTFRGVAIPEYMAPGLEAWITGGRRPGDFLTAVLCNDLARAVAHADENNIGALTAYVGYLHNEAPSACHGSREKFEAWAKSHEDLREAERKARAAQAASDADVRTADEGGGK